MKYHCQKCDKTCELDIETIGSIYLIGYSREGGSLDRNEDGFNNYVKVSVEERGFCRLLTVE